MTWQESWPRKASKTSSPNTWYQERTISLAKTPRIVVLWKQCISTQAITLQSKWPSKRMKEQCLAKFQTSAFSRSCEKQVEIHRNISWNTYTISTMNHTFILSLNGWSLMMSRLTWYGAKFHIWRNMNWGIRWDTFSKHLIQSIKQDFCTMTLRLRTFF